MTKEHGPLDEIGGEWFVNRNEELDRFWKWATGIPDRVHGSRALVGLRRTGKTAILNRLFNRLFYEQERVLPVYISFARYLKRPDPINSYEFAREFFSGFVRSYLAFRYREPELLKRQIEYEKLLPFVQEKNDLVALEWLQDYELVRNGRDERTRAHGIMQFVINLPRGHAWSKLFPMVLLIDEFQVLTRVYNPDSNMIRDMTSSFQVASETHWAPLLVSGSSVSMMVQNALGGGLSGRFQTTRLGPLTQEYAYDMILRLGEHRQIEIKDEVAKAIWEITKGFPYSIECLLKSDCPALQDNLTVAVLQQVLTYELTQTRGALWTHYSEEYGKYIYGINGDQTTRKTLLWIIKYPGRDIFADEIAAELQLEEANVRRSLESLNAADIITLAGVSLYEGPADPLLRRYIEYVHAREVEKLAPEIATQNLLQKYHQLQGETSWRVGHLAEVIVSGVMRCFHWQAVDGQTYFNTPGSVTLPRLDKLDRRGGIIKEGEANEIDLIGEWQQSQSDDSPPATGVWLVSVRHRNEVMGEKEVHAFFAQTATWLTERLSQNPDMQVTRWYISKKGFTKAALQLLQSEGVYYSNLAQFNLLAERFGFLPLKDDKKKR